MKPNANLNLVEESKAEPAAVASTENDDHAFASIAASLAEIRKLKGVIGYILRDDSSAMLDIAESTKISQYALLSYQLHESCLEIAKQFNISEIESVLLEGTTMKVLFMNIGANKISVFMEKDASHSWIIKRILI